MTPEKFKRPLATVSIILRPAATTSSSGSTRTRNARFNLSYRDKKYFAANFDPSAQALQPAKCSPDYVPRRDHTLEVVGVLHQLVGLKKSAADIRTTPFVQVLP